MVVTGGAGMGKSWLLRMLGLMAAERRLPLAQFDFADGQAYDGLLLVRRSRDAFGGEQFPKLSQAIADTTEARVALNTESSGNQPISVSLGGSSFDNSPVAISEVGTVVKDNLFVIQTDNPLVRQAIEDRINTAFFADLAGLSSRQTVVFLFDAYDRLAGDTNDWTGPAHRWIIDQLLTRIRTGKLTNAVIVLAGRETPEFDITWNEVLGRIRLESLSCDDVELYLRERRNLRIITDTEILRLCQAVGGNPQVLGLIGDNLEQANNKTLDDEW